MIATNDIRDVVQNLLQLTQTNQVRWVSDPRHETGRVLYFSTSCIRVIGTEENEPEQRRIIFEDNSWKVVGEWVVHPGEDGWELLNNLLVASWENNRRPDEFLNEDVTVAQRSGQVLKEIQNALRGVETVSKS